ncbi:MAG: cohesin domain-containing protein [Candidatus Zixiibacteriota bacterium]
MLAMRYDFKSRLITLLAGTALIALVGLLGPGCGGDDDSTVPLVDKVFLANAVETTGGQEFTVPIYMENDDPIAAVSLPLRFPSSIMRCDSVSFVGSRCEDFFIIRNFISADTIQIAAIDTVGVGAGSGLFATLHFWSHGNAPDTNILIDLFVNPLLPFGYADTSLAATLIIPQFEAGHVHITTQVE